MEQSRKALAPEFERATAVESLNTLANNLAPEQLQKLVRIAEYIGSEERETVTAIDIFSAASELANAESRAQILETIEKLRFRERFMAADIPKWRSVTRAYTSYDHFRDHYKDWSHEPHFDFDALYEKDTTLAASLQTYASRHKHDLPSDLKFVIRQKSRGLQEAKKHGITTPQQAWKVFKGDPRTAHRIAMALERKS